MRWARPTFLLAFFQGDSALATAVRAPSTAPKNDFLTAITQLAAEKNLPKEVVFEAVEAALASAYKKDDLADTHLAVRIDGNSGGMRVFAQKTVVENEEAIEDDRNEITLEDATTLKAEIVTVEIATQ